MQETGGAATNVILIVEDEALLRDLIVEEFRGAGWVVLEAENGCEALDYLEDTEAIDIIFTDIRLNGRLNGWDVAEACRRKISDLPVVYTTGHAIQPERPVEGSTMLNKPYDPQHVVRVCLSCVEARRF
jgi:CheY-like chemotaxis protein